MTTDAEKPSRGEASRQALSEQHKDAVRSWVPRVRRVLEDEFAAQLERLGFKPSGKHTPVDKMRLAEETVAIRRRVEALIARDSIAEGSAERGYENVKRELAYTLLNRLVGIKAMEARKLLYLPPPGEPHGPPEQTEVIAPVPGQARSRYLRDFRAAGGSKYKYDDDAEENLLRDGLTAVFRHVTQEIRVLFDPDHDYACIWPTHATLARVLKLINEELPEDAYRAQDFLGWVYQFFNREEKKRVRDENKGTPRSSYELAVINQFYTPSWVVKALVDNTLGRLWLQMHPESALAPKEPPPLPDERTSDVPVADYLVPRTGERIRYQRLTEDGEVETFKRARDITLLDPACGTMHFGQYAFGLLHRMYLDEIEHAGQPGWPAEPSVPEPRDIPAAVLEHNLFGVDIDPRAIQIASLSLLLTAKEAALKHGFSPLDVKVHRSNLVVANAVDLGADRLQALVERVGAKIGTPELRQRLFKTIWENLQHVGELGSLVQVREGVEHVLDDWVDATARARGLTKVLARKEKPQLELGSILTDADKEQARQLQLERRLLEAEAHRLQQELLAAIEGAAAQSGANPADRLFAEDTARGLKLLQTLSRQFDVVVMNPPYGSFVPAVRAIAKASYGRHSGNILDAFLKRASQILVPGGYVGALVSDSIQNLDEFSALRAMLVHDHPLVVYLDIGYGILDDATVGGTGLVFASTQNGREDTNAAFFNLRPTHGRPADLADTREQEFSLALGHSPDSSRVDATLGRFERIPNNAFMYREVAHLGHLFEQDRLGNSWAAVRGGMNSTSSEQFVRYHWEVRGSTRQWVRYSKGGRFSRFYSDLPLVFDWTNDGAEFRRLVKERYGSESRFVKSPEFYFKRGLTWTEKSFNGLSVRILEQGGIFNVAGPAAFPKRPSDEWYLLGVLNSSLLAVIARAISGRSYGASYAASWPILEGSREVMDGIGRLAKSIHDAKAKWDVGDEVSTRFVMPWVLAPEFLDDVPPDATISERLARVDRHEESTNAEMRTQLDRLNSETLALAGLAPDGRRFVEATGAHAPPEVLWSEMESRTPEQRRTEHVWRLLSYAVKRVVAGDDDGVVPFSAVNAEPRLVDRVRHELATLFPGRDVNQVEVEIVNELKNSVKGYRKCQSLEDWLDNVFFDYHCALHKKRPIYWHIASTQGTAPFAFGALVQYHRFDKNRMAKLRASYLRDAIEEFRREAGLSDKAGRSDDRLEWQSKIEETQALDKKLQLIQEGHYEGTEGGDRDYRILTPWKTPAERPNGWDPDLDDGVKVNIAPFENAGVLRTGKVT